MTLAGERSPADTVCPTIPRPPYANSRPTGKTPAHGRISWGNLHHQGDVGEASYAAVPILVALAAHVALRGWNMYALAATIESERHARRNPSVPGWLEPEYGQAWRDLLRLALDDLRATDDLLVVQCALAVVALGKGATQLGTLIGHLDQSELTEFLDDAVAWSEHYDDRGSPIGLRRPAG